MGRDSRATSLAGSRESVKRSRRARGRSTFALSVGIPDKASPLLTRPLDPRMRMPGSLLDATRRGSVHVPLGDDADAAAARIEQAIRSHVPASVQRHGSRIYFRGSLRTSTLNALGGSRGMIEVSTRNGAGEASYELDFAPHRTALALFVVVGTLWIPFGVLVLDDRPISLQSAIPLICAVIFGVPAMGVALFNAEKASTAQGIERLLRRALAS